MRLLSLEELCMSLKNKERISVRLTLGWMMMMMMTMMMMFSHY